MNQTSSTKPDPNRINNKSVKTAPKCNNDINYQNIRPIRFSSFRIEYPPESPSFRRFTCQTRHQIKINFHLLQLNHQYGIVASSFSLDQPIHQRPLQTRSRSNQLEFISIEMHQTSRFSSSVCAGRTLINNYHLCNIINNMSIATSSQECEMAMTRGSTRTGLTKRPIKHASLHK